MRKLLISILLASAVATPALADPPSKADREQAREERKQAHEERQQSRQDSRPERPQIQRVERAQPQLQVRPQAVAPTARMQTVRPSNGNVQTARDRADARRQDRVEARDQRFDQRQ